MCARYYFHPQPLPSSPSWNSWIWVISLLMAFAFVVVGIVVLFLFLFFVLFVENLKFHIVMCMTCQKRKDELWMHSLIHRVCQQEPRSLQANTFAVGILP